MASQNKKKGVWGSKGVKFVTLELTREEEQALKSDKGFKERWYLFFDALTREGLKFSCKWDDFNDCASATITRSAGLNDKSDLCYTLRAASLSVAVFKISYYYHIHDATLPSVQSRQEVELEDIADYL